MIVIADDKLELDKYPFLNDEKYTNICKVYVDIKTTDLRSLTKEIENSSLLCYHKSLQLLDTFGKKLSNEDNYGYRKKLTDTAKNKIQFSGGNSEDNIELQTMTRLSFYGNLKLFLDDYLKTQQFNFPLLFYRYMTEDLNPVNTEEGFFTKNNFVFTNRDSKEKNIYDLRKEKSYSDEILDTIVLENLNNTAYDNIYVPLHFKEHDLNGLRLATHIRCTPTVNQLKNIFIYGVVPYEKMIDNPYFDILKTKNVFYVDYNKKALQEAENKPTEPFTENELATEIAKIKLVAPKDNHSIANEWAIYRWAKSIGVSDDDIELINTKIESNLYYKYLKTIYPISATDVDLQELEIQTPVNEKPNILYIDDEWEKGWHEIFKRILSKNSNIKNFERLDINFSQNREEIVNQAVEKIKADDIDIVILDFRLSQTDFENADIEENTSVKILKKIKAYNQGIQVIYFSATNKIWNLQKLQELGADGFIIKEAPENSVNAQFTSETIFNFKQVMETAVKRRFLKTIFVCCENIRKNIEYQISMNISDEYNKFLKKLNTQVKIIEQASSKIDLKIKMSVDVVFLGAYNFLELLKNHYFKYYDKEHRYYIGEEQEDTYNYYFSDKNKNELIKDNDIRKPLPWFCAMTNLFIDYFKICDNESNKIQNLNKVKDKRNKYIHENKEFFDEKEVIMVLSLCEDITTKLKP